MTNRPSSPVLRTNTPDYDRLVHGAALNPQWAQLPRAELRQLLHQKTRDYLAADLGSFEKALLRGECLWLRFLLGQISIEGGLLPDFSDPALYVR
jgi:hypothetical protein